MAVNASRCQTLTQLANEVNRELDDLEVNGAPGEPGADGAAATVDVNSTTTLAVGEDATVTNVGTANAALLDFGIPRGAAGSDGVTPTFSIGTVTTLDAGEDATVTLTGTPPAYVLNFGIPRGVAGMDGTGSNGVGLVTTEITAATYDEGSETLTFGVGQIRVFDDHPTDADKKVLDSTPVTIFTTVDEATVVDTIIQFKEVSGVKVMDVEPCDPFPGS